MSERYGKQNQYMDYLQRLRILLCDRSVFEDRIKSCDWWLEDTNQLTVREFSEYGAVKDFFSFLVLVR